MFSVVYLRDRFTTFREHLFSLELSMCDLSLFDVEKSYLFKFDG